MTTERLFAPSAVLALALAACSSDSSPWRTIADFRLAEEIAKELVGGCPIVPPAIGICASRVVAPAPHRLSGEYRIDQEGSRTMLHMQLREGGEIVYVIEDGAVAYSDPR